MKYEIPVNQKLCLSITEAAQYSMIGENRLRNIIDTNPDLDWILRVGAQIRIKRKQFEEWVCNQDCI